MSRTEAREASEQKVLRALLDGRRFKEVVDETKLSGQYVDLILKSLREQGLLVKPVPVGFQMKEEPPGSTPARIAWLDEPGGRWAVTVAPWIRSDTPRPARADQKPIRAAVRVETPHGTVVLDLSMTDRLSMLEFESQLIAEATKNQVMLSMPVDRVPLLAHMAAVALGVESVFPEVAQLPEALWNLREEKASV